MMKDSVPFIIPPSFVNFYALPADRAFCLPS
jgi:hypothetical protein